MSKYFYQHSNSNAFEFLRVFTLRVKTRRKSFPTRAERRKECCLYGFNAFKWACRKAGFCFCCTSIPIQLHRNILCAGRRGSESAFYVFPPKALTLENKIKMTYSTIKGFPVKQTKRVAQIGRFICHFFFKKKKNRYVTRCSNPPSRPWNAQ
jgi:hypothetical protein